MGIGIGKSCYTNSNEIAPNPSPNNWTLKEKYEFENGYVLVVNYKGCTNFEGDKIMVYKGSYKDRDILDPHFSKSNDSPIARFKPNKEGRRMALTLAVDL